MAGLTDREAAAVDAALLADDWADELSLAPWQRDRLRLLLMFRALGVIPPRPPTTLKGTC